MVVQKVMKCESMVTFDEVFLLDDPKNYCNILGHCLFDEFEFEEMRDYLLQKSANIHKCRSKVVSMFGKYWFQEMDEKEGNSKKNKVIVRLDNIHTEKELSDFMCKDHTVREPLDNV